MKKKENYFKESYEELKNVTWPKKDEVNRSVWIVLAFILVFGVGFSFLDTGFTMAYNAYTAATAKFRVGSGSTLNTGATLPTASVPPVSAGDLKITDQNGKPVNVKVDTK